MSEEITITPDSTLREFFQEATPESGIRVLPVTISKPEDPVAHMMIALCGNAVEVRAIMANLMVYVGDMHDKAEQLAADEDDSGPAIILP